MQKPHMLDNEIKAFLKLCQKEARKHGAVSILEWGSGYSTNYFPAQLEKMNISYTWTAVEHDPLWAENVRNMISANSKIILIEAPLGELYVHAPKGHFNIALVDGRMRNECIKYAKEITDTVILHDAQRKRYPIPGRYIASRLKIIGPDNMCSKVHPLLWKLRVFIWQHTKARFNQT